jgi:FtsZ-binding cell division protein ZapB|tara:strand:- start:525 stop:785 length:261 start_codon:yes stop_codon:yes gene_type:complete
MKHHTDAYPEPITSLLNENKYLKSVKAEEKEKLENTIKIFQKKIEELIETNKILEKELKVVISDNKKLAMKVINLKKNKTNYFFGI